MDDPSAGRLLELNDAEVGSETIMGVVGGSDFAAYREGLVGERGSRSDRLLFLINYVQTRKELVARSPSTINLGTFIPS